MFPSVYNLGRQPGTDQLEYANYDRAAAAKMHSRADQNRFNYLRDQPMNQEGWYSALINGTAIAIRLFGDYGPRWISRSGRAGWCARGRTDRQPVRLPGLGRDLLGGLGGYIGT
jgi:hypothetical protein